MGLLSGKYKNNSDIGSPSKKYFDDEVKKYSYMLVEFTKKKDLIFF